CGPTQPPWRPSLKRSPPPRLAGWRARERDLALPRQGPFFPDVQQPHRQGGCEQPHFRETEPAERPEVDRPRVEKNRLHVEGDEEQRHHVELHRERLPRRADRLRAALERQPLARGGIP